MPDRNRKKVSAGKTPFPGVIIVIAVVVVVLLIIWIARQPRIAASPNGPTSQQSSEVDFSNVTVTPAGGAFNVEGKAKNKTAQPITAITVDVGFDNLSGKTLEKVRGVAVNADGTDLRSNPIPPNQSRPIVLKVMHAPAGWDERAPDLTVVDVEHVSAQGQASTPGQTSKR